MEELTGEVSCRREARLEAAARDPILIPPDPETPLPTLLVWPRVDPMPLREPRPEAGVPRTDPAAPAPPVWLTLPPGTGAVAVLLLVLLTVPVLLVALVGVLLAAVLAVCAGVVLPGALFVGFCGRTENFH